MARWSIDQTRLSIRKRFGNAQLELAEPSLYAMAQRQQYAHYHFAEIKRLVAEFEAAHLADEPLIAVTFGTDEEARSAFQSFMVQSGAHATACVLSIHAIADVTAFAVYLALGYNLLAYSMSNHQVSAKSMRPMLSANSDHLAVAHLLAKLTGDHSFRHVEALANHSKHRGLVKPSLNEDWTGERAERLELRFSALGALKEIGVSQLLSPAYSLASQTVVDVGNKINALLLQDGT